ncbi:MAG: GAF domain-containing protein [Deltaproteobacteria bacterium]|nr:GAF domain-containing protein [Deltaproteobacteria bacterium]
MKTDSQENIDHRVLHTMLKFSSLINSSLKIEDVLNNAMQWAEEFINAEASSIYELDVEKDELFIRLARGEKKEPAKRIRLKMGEGIAGRVVQTGQPMVVQDVLQEKRFSDRFDKIIGFKTRSMICVPLILRGNPIGAIQILNKKNQEPFNQTDLELLTGMAQQIAVAMENAKLYNRLEKQFELTTQELKIAQEKLIRSERLAAIGNLVQGIAHEIRNPVMTIGGFAQRIKESLNEDKGLHEYIDIIMGEAARLERLVKQVREFAGIQSAYLSPDKIEPVIDRVLNRFEPMSERQDVKITTHIEQELPFIIMDSSQIEIALANIVENALESMHDGGKLDLKARRDNDSILIEVCDTGSGIAQEKLDSVYDPFVTSKTRGAGLGLTMFHQIIMNHHGRP